MKQFVLILFTVLTVNISNAQDIIIKLSGDEIKSKILEITSETIKYKEFEFQDGPIRNINISDVFMVMYENGKREKFTIPEDEQNKKDSDFNNDYKANYFMIGTGIGQSYGGKGIRLQARFGRIQGVGIHVGAGYFSERVPFAPTFGIKFFPYKNLYIDAQYGFVDPEEWTDEDNIGRYDARYGPALLVGGDWVWGKKIGYGINIAIGYEWQMNNESEWSQSSQPCADLGFIIRF